MAYGDGFYGDGLFGLEVWAGYPDTGGLPVEVGRSEGGLVTKPGQVQFGDMLMGGLTRLGWRELVGWRDAPSVQVSDTPRPQSHGAYPGDVYADPVTVTFTGLLRGTPESKRAAVDALEANTRLDGVERPLVVDDGTGPWLRMARVIGRTIPQGVHYDHAPLEVSVQFLCADPRRYALEVQERTVELPGSAGGLDYPLTYPLSYGESTSGALTATNTGTEATPPLVEFHGPMDNPVLVTSDWSLGFNITLAEGETLTADTAAGTVLLNGDTDRLYTIRNDSAPLERCRLQPGTTNLSLTATAGTGRAVLTYRNARM